jgi:hypothetical protein
MWFVPSRTATTCMYTSFSFYSTNTCYLLEV